MRAMRGSSIQPTPAGNANLRLIEWPLESTDAADELKRIAELGAGDRARQLDSAKPETLYQLERSLLDDHRIIPLVHLRETYGIAPRVHFQPSSIRTPFALHLEDAWVEQRADHELSDQSLPQHHGHGGVGRVDCRGGSLHAGQSIVRT